MNEFVDEFEYRSDWAKQQFSEMDSDIALRLLDQTIKKSNTLGSYLKDRKEAASKLADILMDKGIVKISSRRSEENLIQYKKALVIGIDSSRQLPYRILNTFYCPITTSIVYFDGIENTAKFDPDSPCTFYEIQNLTPEESIKKIEEEMYKYEVYAIMRVASSPELAGRKNGQRIFVMIDGPLIDPPNKRLYNTYISDRVNALLSCEKNGATVMGCIKRFEGKHVLNFLKERGDIQDAANIAIGFEQDSIIIPFIFKILYSKGNLIETIPIEIKEPTELVNEYKDCSKKNIYRVYFSIYEKGPVMAVDFFSKEEDASKLAEDLCDAARVWALSSLSVPLPVLAAHNRCNIKKGSAEYLYRELKTRALSKLSEEENENILGVFFGGV
jgi:hypothetical protein